MLVLLILAKSRKKAIVFMHYQNISCWCANFTKYDEKINRFFARANKNKNPPFLNERFYLFEIMITNYRDMNLRPPLRDYDLKPCLFDAVRNGHIQHQPYPLYKHTADVLLVCLYPLQRQNRN